MPTHIPTKIGDVLILRTEKTFSVHAVGVVTENRQQGFRDQAEHVKHVSSRAEALTEARSLLAPGRRIFLLDIDSGEWSEVQGLLRHPH
jgi:hypothetical protein